MRSWLGIQHGGAWQKVLFVGLGLAAGCGKLDRERPHIARVMPGMVRTGSVEALSVEGENFYARADVKLAKPDDVTIKSDFRVFIDNTEVLVEGRVTPTQLTIKSTANLALGGHSVTVITPEGYSDTLPLAFTVSDAPLLSAAGGSMNSGGTAAYVGGMSNLNSVGGSSNLGGQGSTGSGSTTGTGGNNFTAGGSGGASPGAGGASTASGGSGGALINGCLEYDTLSTLCIHSCKLTNPTTIDYCNMLFFADTADCVYSQSPNPDTCEQLTGTGELEVGLDRPSVGVNAQAYFSFNINRLPPSGHSITAAYVVFQSTKNTLAPSNSSGALWLSEPFTRTDLFTKSPMPTGALPLGADLGAVNSYQQAGWTLEPGTLTIPGKTYMTLVPSSSNSVHYYNLKNPNERPYIQIEYQ